MSRLYCRVIIVFYRKSDVVGQYDEVGQGDDVGQGDIVRQGDVILQGDFAGQGNDVGRDEELDVYNCCSSYFRTAIISL